MPFRFMIDGDRRPDDHGGHQFIDPRHTETADDQGDDHIDQTGQRRTDDETEVSDRDRNGTSESGAHRAEEGEGGTEEDRALELGEELIDQRAAAGTEEGGGSRHSVTDGHRHRDRGGQNGEELLQGEHEDFGELGFVLDTVDELHELYLRFEFLSSLRRRARKKALRTARPHTPIKVSMIILPASLYRLKIFGPHLS